MADFSEVYDLYFRDVYKYALGLCRNETIAEEVTQETFFKALRSIDQFDGKCRLYVWLCQIAKNTYFTLYQKERRIDRDAQPEESTEGLEQQFLAKESAFEIHRILHKMEEPYKEVFSLRAFGELRFRQIGELFGKTESWARVTYHRAKLQIKEELK